MKIKRIEGILHELGEFNWIRELKVKEFDISVEFMNLTCLVGIEKERVCVWVKFNGYYGEVVHAKIRKT